MAFATSGDAGLFAEHAKRFVLSAWQASRDIGSGRTADLRGRQRQLFSFLSAMVQARMRCTGSSPEPFPGTDRRLRRLAASAMRFVLCDPDDIRKLRLFARTLGDRAFPLLHAFSGGPGRPLLALPPPARPASQPANQPTGQNVIRIDFRTRRRY